MIVNSTVNNYENTYECMLISSCCQRVVYRKNQAGKFYCHFCWVAVFVVSWEYNCFSVFENLLLMAF